MNLHSLVFSDRKQDRLIRHGLFCLCLFAYSLVRIGIMFPPEQLWHSFAGFISFTIYWTALILLFSYATVYFLVPVFFRKEKYFLFSLGLITLLALLYAIVLVQNYLRIYESFITT